MVVLLVTNHFLHQLSDSSRHLLMSEVHSKAAQPLAMGESKYTRNNSIFYAINLIILTF